MKKAIFRELYTTKFNIPVTGDNFGNSKVIKEKEIKIPIVKKEKLINKKVK